MRYALWRSSPSYCVFFVCHGPLSTLVEMNGRKTFQDARGRDLTEQVVPYPFFLRWGRRPIATVSRRFAAVDDVDYTDDPRRRRWIIRVRQVAHIVVRLGDDVDDGVQARARLHYRRRDTVWQQENTHLPEPRGTFRTFRLSCSPFKLSLRGKSIGRTLYRPLRRSRKHRCRHR